MPGSPAATMILGTVQNHITKKNRPLLNVVRHSLGAQNDDSDNAAGKHRPGLGKHPVRDLVQRILGGDDDDDNAAPPKAEEDEK
jgi:hypothetical protein